ncbi:hypothetical protein EfmAA96_15080 [Enterococcus faecium]|nr:hypothetical protein EfmAA96_15080 [Enterococcus faecium]
MIGLIVARSKNNVIGKNGNIPWKIKGEQKQFRELTTGNVVIMGRKSYEEIGHPLPNRMNIVVSTTTEYQGDNLVSVKSLEDALLLAKGRDVYISGGYGHGCRPPTNDPRGDDTKTMGTLFWLVQKSSFVNQANFASRSFLSKVKRNFRYETV